MRGNRQRLAFVAAGIAVALTLAGAALAALQSHSTAAGTTVKVTEREYHIALSTAAPGAGTIVFKIHNAGHIAHQFDVSGGGLKSTAKAGTILLPWGSDSTVIPLVSGEDVARVAVGVLTAPSIPPGSSYPVIGEVLALRDIVAIFSRVLGREVRYHEIPDQLWYDGARQRGFNQHAIEHLSQLWRAIRNGPASSEKWEPTATIEALGGRKAKTFEEFVRDEKSAFNGFSQ